MCARTPLEGDESWRAWDCHAALELSAVHDGEGETIAADSRVSLGIRSNAKQEVLCFYHLGLWTRTDVPVSKEDKPWGSVLLVLTKIRVRAFPGEERGGFQAQSTFPAGRWIVTQEISHPAHTAGGGFLFLKLTCDIFIKTI